MSDAVNNSGEWVGLCRHMEDAALWVRNVFTDPDVLAAVPERQRSDAWRDETLRRVAAGGLWVFGCVSDKRVAGLYLAAPCDGGGLFVHQFILPGFRRHSTAFARVAAACAFSEFPDVRHLVGLTPLSRRAAVLVALRAGFRKCGVWPAWYDGEDCQCLILRREDCRGSK